MEDHGGLETKLQQEVKMQRRDFLKTGAMTGMDVLLGGTLAGSRAAGQDSTPSASKGPLVISTWRHGVTANMAAFAIMRVSGKEDQLLDAPSIVAKGDK